MCGFLRLQTIGDAAYVFIFKSTRLAEYNFPAQISVQGVLFARLSWNLNNIHLRPSPWEVLNKKIGHIN